MIYNSRNFIWVLNLLTMQELHQIYNSRNFIWVLNGIISKGGNISTTVEILFGF